MKYNDVRNALIATYPDAKAAMESMRMPMLRVIAFAIVDLWVNKTPDNEDTELLRAAIKHLDAGGYLDPEENPPCNNHIQPTRIPDGPG